jgi:hypothetical protein
LEACIAFGPDGPSQAAPERRLVAEVDERLTTHDACEKHRDGEADQSHVPRHATLPTENTTACLLAWDREALGAVT